MMKDNNQSYSAYRWVILVFLFLATTAVYYNRQVYSITSIHLKEALAIGDTEFGYGVTAFQFTYMIGFILAGKVIDVLGARTGLSLTMFIWSLASGLTAFSGGVVSLTGYRGLLGLTQAGHFPAAIKIVAEWFPPRQRAFATSLFNSGPSLALMTCGVITAWLVTPDGLGLPWQYSYYFFGGGSVLLAGVWLVIYRHNRTAAGTVSELNSCQPVRVKWGQLILHRQSWGIMAGKFCTDPVWWFYMAWLPNFLYEKHGFNIKDVAYALPVIYGISILLSNVAGWAAGKLIDCGMEAIAARKRVMLVCALCLPVTAVAGFTSNGTLIILLVGLACAAHSGWSANIFTLVSDCYRPETVGSMTGLAGFAGALGGVIITGVIPTLLIETWGYTPIFVLMGVLHPLAYIILHLQVRKEQVKKLAI